MIRGLRVLGVVLLLLGLGACGGGSGGSTPRPDFSLAVATPSVRLRVDASRAIDVTVVRSNGHQGAITLSLADAPTGVSGSGVIDAGASTGKLTLVVGTAATPQVASIKVRGTSGTLVHEAAPSVTLSVVAAGPGENRITAFAVTASGHPVMPVSSPGEVAQGSDGGTLSAFIPAGTGTTVAMTFATDGGTVSANGSVITSPATVDLSRVSELVVTDEPGNTQRYAIEVSETGLPSVFVRTSGEAPIVSKDDYVAGDVTILGGTTDYARPLPTSTMKIRGRGNSTWDQPKKPYRFKLDAATSVLGLPAARDWVLLANHYDMSLMRNTVAFDAARTLSGLAFTPTARPVDLYLNGEYAGSYVLTEQLEVGANRIAIEAPTQDVDTGYWIEANSRIVQEGGVEGVDFFRTNGGFLFEHKSPKGSSLTVDQRAFVQSLVQRIEDGVPTGVPPDVDVASFVDWLIVEEVFKNQDSAFLSSVHLYRDKGQAVHLGPVWDFDLAAGNSNYGEIGGFPLNDWQGWFPKYSAWYDGLFRQIAFSQAFKARWVQVREPLHAAILASIDHNATLLEKSQRQNFQRWRVLGVGTWATPPELLAADTWEAQVDALRTWIDRRFEWMDAELNRLYPF